MIGNCASHLTWIAVPRVLSLLSCGVIMQTEKLLLYGGAIHEAGAVKARRSARHATSDWMDLEKQRGMVYCLIPLCCDGQLCGSSLWILRFASC